MKTKRCCINPPKKEDTNNKKNFRVLHECVTDSITFRWSICEKCGGIYLDKMNNIAIK